MGAAHRHLPSVSTWLSMSPGLRITALLITHAAQCTEVYSNQIWFMSFSEVGCSRDP
jgi:hypothetical protein